MKRKIQRIAALLVTAAALAGFAACKSDKKPDDGTKDVPVGSDYPEYLTGKTYGCDTVRFLVASECLYDFTLSEDDEGDDAISAAALKRNQLVSEYHNVRLEFIDGGGINEFNPKMLGVVQAGDPTYDIFCPPYWWNTGNEGVAANLSEISVFDFSQPWWYRYINDDLASITDQSDYRLLGALAANVTEFIHPSQCGIWSWTDCAEGVWDFVLAMTNSMIGRMHICGDFASLSDEKRSLLKEACAFYKSYRHIFSSCRTYHHTLPETYTHGGAKLRCTELRAENNAEAVVVAQRVGSDTDGVNVKFPGLLPGEYTITTYPSSEPVTAASAMLASEGIDIKLPSEICGRAVYLRKNDN